MHRFIFASLFSLATALHAGNAVAQQWVADFYQGVDQTMAELMRVQKDEKQFSKIAAQNFGSVRKQLLPIAEAGDPVAQYMLAKLHSVSSMLTRQDRKLDQEALQWALLATKQNFQPAYMLSLQLDYSGQSNLSDCTDRDTKPRDKPKNCKLIIERYRQAAYAGDVSAMQSMPLVEMQTKTDLSTYLGRKYIWQRLAIDFMPSANWSGYAAMPEKTRQEHIAQRKEEEQTLQTMKAEMPSTLSPVQLAALDQEYRETNARIKKAIVQWKSRYPALKAGEHGWY